LFEFTLKIASSQWKLKMYFLGYQ